MAGLVLLLAGLGSAWATAPGGLGVGAGAGLGVMGISAKYHLSNTAVQMVAGVWGVDELVSDQENELRIGPAVELDYLLEMPDIAHSRLLDVSWNVGGGATGALPTGIAYVSAGLIAGLELCPRRVPIDIVLEYHPEAAFLPRFWLQPFNFSGHVRYYF